MNTMPVPTKNDFESDPLGAYQDDELEAEKNLCGSEPSLLMFDVVTYAGGPGYPL